MISNHHVVHSLDNVCSSSGRDCTDVSCIPCKEPEQVEEQARDSSDPASENPQALTLPVETHAHSIHVPERLISQIPFEIFSHIFCLSIPSSFEDYSDFESTPLILGAVCQMWRDFAWSTPQLWNRIKIQFTPRSLKSKAEIACEWLNRSGQLPLSIRIYLAPNFIHDFYTPASRTLRLESEYSNHFYPLASLINESSHRLYYLDLDSVAQWLLSTLAGPQGSSMLHTLQISSWSGLSFCPDGKVFAPSVIKVSNLTFPSLGINWANVTRVQVHHFSCEECLEVIRLAPLLVDCTFLDITPNGRNYLTHEGQRFSNPHLKVLDLRPEKPGIETFFRRVSFPFLERLEFGLENDYATTIPVDDIITFLARSSPLLQCLKIFHPYFDIAEDLIRICEAAPFLTELLISFGWLGDRRCRRWETDFDAVHLLLSRLSETWLATNHHTMNFLPQLEKLVYDGPWLPINSLDMIPKAFGPMSDIRNPFRRPFSSFCIKFLLLETNPYDEDFEEALDKETMDRAYRGETADRLQELRDHGINIQIDLEGPWGEQLKWVAT
ncbi:hypothetical protein M413DRAFT_31367 [Hebeloma cylindrosporum]|uniref:Uncharacterized protein n=1 Tax=Hebeloma cylindrosporum TaxID=76867 RepID=A0A0C2Y6S7_HEBCY|nr:hypothetical protein M413DRAFT_31367 [Hebeloma cylindrosporum h7]